MMVHETHCAPGIMHPLPSAPNLLSRESESVHVLFSYIYCFFHFVNLHWSSEDIMTSAILSDWLTQLQLQTAAPSLCMHVGSANALWISGCAWSVTCQAMLLHSSSISGCNLLLSALPLPAFCQAMKPSCALFNCATSESCSLAL